MGTQEFGSLRNSLRAMKLECGRPVSPQGKGRPYPGGRGQGGPLSGSEWGTGVSLSLAPLHLQGVLDVIPTGPLKHGQEMPGGSRDSPVSSCFPSFPLRILCLSLAPFDLRGGLPVIPINPLQEGLEMPGGGRNFAGLILFPFFSLVDPMARYFWMSRLK